MDKSFSLAHQVFKVMEQAIITEEIPRGTELTELALSAKYGVSRTPIREAIAMLEQEDLVHSKGKWMANFQASLLGIEAGSEKIRGFAELGAGEQGIILAGLRYKF